MRIDVVAEQDLPVLLPLLRAYCDFYDSHPGDHDLLAISRALIEDPNREGVQFLARDGRDVAGFATLYWSWETNTGGRVGVMNDLFVVPAARGAGVGEALITACLERCRVRGARRLTWQTAPGNLRAQALYARVGAVREQWVDYWLAADREG
jgi:GNAT superfamily N-acetyltransferase